MTVAPTFLSIPCLVVGTPVFFATFCFNAVIPMALFRENDNPGIFMSIYLLYCFLNFLTLLIISFGVDLLLDMFRG